MKTFLPLATVLTCALVAAPAFAGQHFVVVERPTDEITTDIGAKGDSPGDLLTFANPVFDAANKTQVGSDQGYCVRIVVGKSWECNWTMIMKGGQITIEGPFMDAGDSLFVVTGGSGKYAGAAGQMKLHPRDEKSSSYDFTFDLR